MTFSLPNNITVAFFTQPSTASPFPRSPTRSPPASATASASFVRPRSWARVAPPIPWELITQNFCRVQPRIRAWSRRCLPELRRVVRDVQCRGALLSLVIATAIVTDGFIPRRRAPLLTTDSTPAPLRATVCRVGLLDSLISCDADVAPAVQDAPPRTRSTPTLVERASPALTLLETSTTAEPPGTSAHRAVRSSPAGRRRRTVATTDPLCAV